MALMKHVFRVLALIGLLAIWGWGCAPPPDNEAEQEQEQPDIRDLIRESLAAEPDIIFDILRNHPAELVDILEFALQQADSGQTPDGQVASPVPLAPRISTDRPVRGNPGAEITMVVYSDFLCPYCAQLKENLGALLAEEGDQARLIFKHMPLNAASRELAVVFEALARQDHDLAWAFHDALFARQDEARADPEGFVHQFTQEAGVDAMRFSSDRGNADLAVLVDADLEEAARFGFDGAPALVVNGFGVHGAIPVQELRDIMEHVRPREPLIVPGRPILGREDAPISLVMYADFLCPYCSTSAEGARNLLDENPDGLRLVLKHMPIINDASRELAVAFEVLGQYGPQLPWNFAQRVFARQEQVSQDLEGFLDDFAHEAGIDPQDFAMQRASPDVERLVDGDLAEAESFGYLGVPVVLVNGKPVHGLVKPEELREIIALVRSKAF
jgi:protein-disulfide isomerase